MSYLRITETPLAPGLEQMRMAFRDAYARKTLRQLESEERHIRKEMTHSRSKVLDLKYQIISEVILEKKRESNDVTNW